MATTVSYYLTPLNCPSCCTALPSCPCPMTPTKLKATMLTLTGCTSISGCPDSNLPSFIGVPIPITWYPTDPGTIGGVGWVGPGWYGQIKTYISPYPPCGHTYDLVIIMGCFSQSQVVVGYTNNGSGAIRVEVGTTAPLGTYVIITGSGTAMADGTWKIHIIDATHFDLIGSTYVGPGAFFFGNAGYYTMGLNLEPETSADGQNPQDFLTCVPSFEADFNSVVTDQSCDAVAAVSSWKITV